jgi:transketolase
MATPVIRRTEGVYGMTLLNPYPNKIKREILTTAYNAGEGHIASSLSIVELLYVLYDNVLKEEDYFILSKGHASLGWYAVLNHFGYITDEDSDSFCKPNGLPGHPDRLKTPCIHASTGSLGHGLPIGVGIALGLKAANRSGKVYVLIGDGEANEGAIWEAANLAVYHDLDNLCCIVDCNGSADRALTTYIPKVFSAFGWVTNEIVGHNMYDIHHAINDTAIPPRLPYCVVAITTKGYGVSFMENNPEWHHKTMNEEQYQQAMKELE